MQLKLFFVVKQNFIKVYQKFNVTKIFLNFLKSHFIFSSLITYKKIKSLKFLSKTLIIPFGWGGRGGVEVKYMAGRISHIPIYQILYFTNGA